VSREYAGGASRGRSCQPAAPKGRAPLRAVAPAFRAEPVERLLAPLDRLEDLLDEVAEPMRRQVEAIHEAAAAPERVAALLDAQLALVGRARVAWRERAAALRP
jgi:hypothetical protein